MYNKYLSIMTAIAITLILSNQHIKGNEAKIRQYRVTLLRKYDLTKKPSQITHQQGEVKWTEKGLYTASNPKLKQPSDVYLETNYTIPHSNDGYLLRVEWALIPIKIGKWGQCLMLRNATFFIEFKGTCPTLNGYYRAKDTVREGKPLVISCDFNKHKIFSWKINGKEQLDKPVAAYKMSSERLSIQMVDWMETDSKTLWKQLSIYRIDAQDNLPIRLSGWDRVFSVKKDTPTSFIVGQASPMIKVFREASDFHESLSSVVNISSAGRERESFQLVVIPLGQSLNDVSVTVSDLLHSDGKTRLHRKNIKWFPVGYVRTSTKAISPTGRKGWLWPDILLPAQPFDVTVGYVQPVWFTVYVPHGTKAGRYHGLIDMRDCRGNKATVGLELDVRKYSLPVRGKLKTACSICPGMWEMWYYPDEVKKRLGIKDDEIREDLLYTSNECANVLPHKKWLEMYEFLLAHRLNPTTLYSALRDGKARVIPAKGDMEYCYKRGMNATCLFCVGHISTDPKQAKRYMDDLKSYLKKWERFVKTKQWPDFTWYMHCFDETETHPDKRKYFDYAMKTVLDPLGKYFPWLKRETANPYIPRHKARFDIFTPLTDQIDKHPDLYDKLISEGREIWAYVCCGPGYPYANLFIDCPGIAPRILAWQLYKYRIKGFLYYLMNLYWNQKNWNKRKGKWPECPWNTFAFNRNGDGLLFYPGPDATPLASIRLENLRDGIEDYEALALLEDLTKRVPKTKNNALLLKQIRKHLKVPDKVTSSWKIYTKDPATVTDARATTDKLIEQCLIAITQNR